MLPGGRPAATPRATAPGTLSAPRAPRKAEGNAKVLGGGAVLYAGVWSVGVAFTLQVVCQKHCPPGPAAVIMSMEAVFAALAGYLVLGQTLTLRAMLGCGLILCGVLIVQLVPVARMRAALADLGMARRPASDGRRAAGERPGPSATGSGPAAPRT